MDALVILGVENGVSKREIKLRYMTLARKYYPDKWYEECAFDAETGECIFKNVSNAYGVLRE